MLDIWDLAAPKQETVVYISESGDLVYQYRYPEILGKGIRAHDNGVTNNCEPSNIGVKN